MSNKISYKNLFQLVTEQIDKRVSYNNKSTYDSQLSRVSVSPLTGSDRSDASTGELVTAIQSLLSESLPSWIITGLTVEATTPISSQVTVSAGKGTVGGFLYELSEAVTLTIPFNNTNEIFYITLYKDNIYVDKTLNPDRLTIAKIIIPNPGVTSLIQNDKDSSWNAYIVNFKEYKLYGYNDKFEEDTVELLRNNISPILADNLIGNIRLNEDLKITNTQGTMELNSAEMKLLDSSGDTLAKFNRNGTFFYDENNTIVAKFGRDEAYIGNILMTKNSLQSRNYVAGSTGFKIEDDGDVEFSDGTFRGILSAVTGNIGGWTIDSNSIYATTTGTLKTSVNVGVGSDGVILDKDGLRMYDDILGLVVNLPSNGNAPTFSSGVINSTIFEIDTSSVLRTSESVGVSDTNVKFLSHLDEFPFIEETDKIITNSGVTLDTSIKKIGNGSASFNGSSYLAITNNPDFAFGSGAFTIEMYVMFTSLAGVQVLYSKRANSSAVTNIVIALYLGSVVCWATSNGSSFDIINGETIGTPSLNTWYHIAVARNGNSWYGFFGGAIMTLSPSSSSLQNVTSNICLGSDTDSQGFNGRMNEVRISDTCRWTSSFTPPITKYTVSDAGILINNTGIYGCAENQKLENANLKALIDGTVSLRGEITATSGSIASISITNEGLSGGLIEGSTIRGSVIETSSTAPKIRIDSLGLYYQTAATIGKYGASTSGNYGFKYGSGTKYGSSVTAYLFKNDYPVLSIESELDTADIRLYNRTVAPTSGTHKLGDLIVINGLLYSCSVAGSPGTFSLVNSVYNYALEDLTDVMVNSGTSDGDLLTWDAGDSMWRNKQPSFTTYTDTRHYLGGFSRDMSSASGNQTITLSGISWVPKAIICIAGQTNIAGHLSFGMYADGYSDTGTHDAWLALNGAFVINDSNFIYILQNAGGTQAYYGDIASVGAGEFTITWTKVGSATGTLACMYLALR
jgi:hypothetical protein